MYVIKIVIVKHKKEILKSKKFVRKSPSKIWLRDGIPSLLRRADAIGRAGATENARPDYRETGQRETI